MQATRHDVVVVGGGLGGLAAGALAARAGLSTVILEKAPAAGGRASTREVDGFSLNIGPHAIYRDGAAARLFRELGVAIPGRRPAARGLGLREGTLHRLPGSLDGLLSTSLLPVTAKVRFATTMARLLTADRAAWAGSSVAEALDRWSVSGPARDTVEALIRLATYCAAPREISAGAAFARLQDGRTGVLYVDGGWQTLVHGLQRVAEAAGATVRTGTAVEAVEGAAPELMVRLRDGSVLSAGAVVIAGSPHDAVALLDDRSPALRSQAGRARPIRAACLDVALRRLPVASNVFALGIDVPVYASVHSTWAKLAPAGGAVVHVARYLAPDEDGTAAERGLESFLDTLQPGWQAEVVHRRFLPHPTVSHALPAARDGGLPGRAIVPDLPGVYVAGDWVESDGLLVDAVVASAIAAVASIVDARSGRKAA